MINNCSCSEIERQNMNRTLHTKHFNQPSKYTQQMTLAEHKELSRIWKEIERKWNVSIDDVSAEMTLCTEIVKEVTFKGKPDSEPLHIRLDWDSVVYGEDGNVLSEFEIEKNVAVQVDLMLECIASEESI